MVLVAAVAEVVAVVVVGGGGGGDTETSVKQTATLLSDGVTVLSVVERTALYLR